MVTGAPSTPVMAYTVRADIPAFAHTSYYSDDLTPLVTQCAADAREYGAGGFRVDHDLPDTDPAAELTTPLTAVAGAYGPTVAVGLLPPAPWVRSQPVAEPGAVGALAPRQRRQRLGRPALRPARRATVDAPGQAL
jgi:hypothetical protein